VKHFAAIALLILACVPADAQVTAEDQPQARPPIEFELLEMQQTADKAALKEAMLLEARQGMCADKNLSEKASEDLAKFIAKKREAIIARAAELAKGRVANRRGMGADLTSNQPADRQAAIEKAVTFQVEAQLLQAQIQLLHQPLNEAAQTLATAEVAAEKDESKKPELEAARKNYEKIKAKVVEYTKKQRMAQQEMGMPGFGGSMGGGGGGFR
jgi:hypothetical protein